MDASASRHRLSGDIDLEVASLAKEVILVGKPIISVTIVRVDIDHSEVGEVGTSLERRNVEKIAHYMRVVELIERSRY